MRPLLLALTSALQWLFLASWSVLWISMALVVSIFSRDLPLVMARRGWAPALVWASRARLEFTGAPALDPRGPYVFVMNHQSMLDIALAFMLIPLNLRFIAKRVLKSVPFLGWYMARTRMVFVDRANRRQALASLAQAGRQIREGASIIAYPEGTRSTGGEILPFKKGTFVIAIEAGVPIVPVAVDGSNFVVPRGSLLMHPHRVRVKIGEPIPTAGLTQDDLEILIRRVRDAVIDLHQDIGGAGGDREQAIALPGHEGIGRAVRRRYRAA